MKITNIGTSENGKYRCEEPMTRCLACEIHLIVRIAMRFTKEAIREERYTLPVSAMVQKFGKRNVHVDFSNENNRFPAILTMIVDVQTQNAQRRTVNKVVRDIKKLIDGNDLEEGFIETHETSDVFDLLPMAEDMKACGSASTSQTTHRGR